MTQNPIQHPIQDPIKERMRADIARLLRLSPEEIGDEDDLSDLGLDSMRSMNLLVLWEKAGLRLDFAALAERLTLAHWAGVAARAQGTAAGA